MYCAKCGVKLADTEKICPLCGTKAHPDLARQEAEPLYPPEPPVQVNSKAVHGVVLALFLLPLLICLQCDLIVTGSVTWSGYVAGALILAYVLFALPYWFRKPNPVVFVPCGFAAAGVYLLYIDLATRGGWFMGFGLPVVAGLCLIVTAVVALMRYVPKGALYIFGGAFIALGLGMLLMGWLLNVTFFSGGFALWSLYPMTALVLLGGLLIFLAICRPARETMQRKFFI
nr:zinc ribbon domain-containing protein [Oscillospiraceae bacterium]MBQ8245444.1 zinc ribbon domain-containing protein [Oscillospiraceae bacterium]